MIINFKATNSELPNETRDACAAVLGELKERGIDAVSQFLLEGQISNLIKNFTAEELRALADLPSWPKSQPGEPLKFFVKRS